MTQKSLEWQTARFLELETHREGITVLVRPVVVAEIALDGVQVSTRYVRLLAKGERGSGFPPPVSHVRGRNRLWRWADVAHWSGRAEEARDAYALAAVNALLDMRVLREIIPDEWKHLAYSFTTEAVELLRPEEVSAGGAAAGL
jgi:hypothetical protein